MPSIRVRIRGRKERDRPKHRKVTLKLGAEVLTFPIASREVQITDLSPEWVQIPRPGQRPLLRRAHSRLRQVQLDVVFVKGGLHVESGLQILRRFANAGSPLALSYGPSESGMFRITDMRVRSTQREYGTNNITQAEVSLTLTEAFNDGYQQPAAVKAATPATPAKSTPKPAPTAAKPRVHVVKRGDTLSKIAARYYGNANRFGDIAKANKISNPNRIFPGQRLVIP